MRTKLLLSAFLISLAALAPRPAGAAPLTWAEIRGAALGQSPPSLESALRSQQAARSVVKQAYGDFLPSVTLSAKRNRSTTEFLSLNSTETQDTYGGTASLNLFNGFASVSGVRRAYALEEQSAAQRDLTSAQLRYDLRLAYFNVYVQEERIALYEKVLKRAEQNEKLISLKYNSGTEARWNVQKTRAELDRAKFNVQNAQAERQSAREQLARLLHLPALPEREAAEPDATIYLNLKLDDESLAQAHPQLRRSSAELNQRGLETTIARASFWPSLDLSYTRTESLTKPETSAHTRVDTNSWLVSAQWNIFNGLSDFHKVQEANLIREAAELSRESLRRQLLADLRVRATAYRQAVERLPLLRALKAAADERVRTLSAQYRAGLKSYLEWEQAENQLLDAELAEVTARRDALNALADLERSLGKTLEQP
jgi:outer membrane protein TolC